MPMHLRSVLFASVLLAIATASSVEAGPPVPAEPMAQIFSIEPSMDRPGADYRELDLPVADVEPCRRACAEDPRCAAYTYADPGLVSAAPRCFLKADAPPQVGKRGCTSGARVRRAPISQSLDRGLSIEPSTDRPGADYKTFDLPAPDVEPCRRACAADARCAAYTYADPGLVGPAARCFLKDAAPLARPKKGCTSGARPGPIAPSPQVEYPALEVPLAKTRRGAVVAPRRQPIVRDCGTGAEDAGCQEYRDGAVPLDASAWAAVASTVKAEPNELSRRDIAVASVGDRYITARQLIWLLDQIGNELTRLELARLLVDHVVDPQRAIGYAARFNNSFNRRDFLAILRPQ